MSHSIHHTELENPYMTEAKRIALDQPLSKQPYLVGSVIVKNNQIIGKGNNYNPYHKDHGCDRRKLAIPSGVDYHLCQGCDPDTHSEPRAIQNALQNGHDVTGAELYLYGHHYACEHCTRAMKENQIVSCYIVSGAESLFSLKNN